MDDTRIQNTKNDFFKYQDPPIYPCTNTGCKFTGYTCGSKWGCHIKEQIKLGELIQCGTCRDFKEKNKMETKAVE